MVSQFLSVTCQFENKTQNWHCPCNEGELDTSIPAMSFKIKEHYYELLASEMVIDYNINQVFLNNYEQTSRDFICLYGLKQINNTDDNDIVRVGQLFVKKFPTFFMFTDLEESIPSYHVYIYGYTLS